MHFFVVYDPASLILCDYSQFSKLSNFSNCVLKSGVLKSTALQTESNLEKMLPSFGAFEHTEFIKLRKFLICNLGAAYLKIASIYYLLLKV